MLVTKFKKNLTEEIRLEILKFKGKKYLNFRIWFKDDDGEYHPSKKGITISTDLVDDLKKAIDKAAFKVYEELPGPDPK